MIVLRDMEKVFQQRYHSTLAWLISGCMLGNLGLFVMSVVSANRSAGFLGRLLQLILCVDPSDAGKLEGDLIMMQLSIFWLLIDFTINVIHFFVASHLIEDRTEVAKEKVVQSLLLRFYFHTTSYSGSASDVSQTMHAKFVKTLNEIVIMKENRQDLFHQNTTAEQSNGGGRSKDIEGIPDIELAEDGEPDGENKKASRKGSDSLFNSSDSSDNMSLEREPRPAKNTELFVDKNVVLYEFSPLTKVDDKFLFIYFNKSKYLIGRAIRSLLFNTQRLSICLMLLSLCYSQSLLDYILPMFCVYFSLREQHFFIDSNFNHVLYYSIYFVINWIVIRCDSPLIQAGSIVKNHISPSGIAVYNGYFLLLGVTVYSLGFVVLLLWTAYTTYRLLSLRADSNSIFSLVTTDGYQVLDYNVWKKNNMSRVNFLFKVAQTKLLELYALLTFVTCIYINRHLYFITSVLLIVFLIVLMDGIKSMKSLFKFFKFDSTLMTGEQQFVSSLRFIRILCWLAVVLESYDIFKTSKIVAEDMDLSPGVLVIYYITLTFGDTLRSAEYIKNRDQVELEESVKADYIALNYTYKFNEDKLMKRLYAFIGKSKLDKMAADAVTEVDFSKVELHMDYNKAYLPDILMKVYDEILALMPSKIRILKHKLVNTIYRVLHNNTNLYRSMDLFVLYKTVLRKNRNLVINADMNLKAYFCNDYKQLQDNLVTIDRYYESVKEGFPDATEMITKQLKILSRSFEQSKSSKFYKGKTYKELATYEWMKEEETVENEVSFSKPPEFLERAVNLIYRRVTKNQDNRLLGVEFEDLKPSLIKKGLITAFFGKRKIALFNLNEDIFMKTHGFVEFNLANFIGMVLGWISSNNIPLAFWTITVCSCLTGSAFTIIILAILLFAVLIEETYGNVFWWRILNIIYLFKIMIQIFNQSNSSLFYFLVGDSVWTDISLMVCINVVMFYQKKTGFESSHLIKVEDVGTAATRILVNEDLMNMVDGCIKTQQTICYELTQYLEKKLKKQVTGDTLKVIKSKCTYLIVKMFFEIDKFKSEAHKAAINLFKELAGDTKFINPEKADSFLWRNFSILSRKPGAEVSQYIYTALACILGFAVLFLQNNETGRTSVLAFVSGSQAISAQTVLTILAYVMLGVFEKWFENIRNDDSITVRYHSILPKMCKHFAREQGPPGTEKTVTSSSQSKLEKFRAFVQKIVIALRLKPESRGSRSRETNPLVFKYFFSIFLYLLICFLCFVLQPVLATAQRRSLYTINFNSFKCIPTDKDCFSFSTLWITQAFFFLNVVYFYFCIQEMRKGKLQAIPLDKDYSEFGNQLHYLVYYKTPILRETCTLIDYSAQLTTLEFSDSLLCEDIKEYIIKAKMLHQANSEKNPGKLIPWSQRVIVSWTVIFLLVLMLLLPLVIFSKFTSGDREQEITEGSLNIVLFAGEDRYLTHLYRSQFLLENRKLGKVFSCRPQGKRTFGESPANPNAEQKQDASGQVYQFLRLLPRL